MGVPKHKRGESPMEFMHNALALQKEVTELLLRDFGVRRQIRTNIQEAKIDEESAAALENLKIKYGMEESDQEKIEQIISNATVEAQALEAYPQWIIDYHRSATLRVLESLINNLYYANSIYIMSEAEYTQRRGYWNAAIGNCYQLAARFDTVRHTILIDANKYEPYLKRIKREIALIKGVRSADNKVLAKLQNKNQAK